jgi:hypothetical protein
MAPTAGDPARGNGTLLDRCPDLIARAPVRVRPQLVTDPHTGAVDVAISGDARATGRSPSKPRSMTSGLGGHLQPDADPCLHLERAVQAVLVVCHRGLRNGEPAHPLYVPQSSRPNPHQRTDVSGPMIVAHGSAAARVPARRVMSRFLGVAAGRGPVWRTRSMSTRRFPRPSNG